MNTFNYFTLYLKSLLSFSPKRFILGCLLNILNTMLSGVGLLLLIPVLHYSGWLPNQKQSNDDLLDKLTNLFPHIQGHLPLILTLSVFVLLMLMVGGIGYWQNRVMNEFQLDYLYHLRKQMNQAIAQTKWRYLLMRKLRHVEHMMTSVLPQVSTLTHVCLQLISLSLVIGVYLIFSFLIAFKLTLITCVTTLVLFFLLNKSHSYTSGQRIFGVQRSMQEQLAQFLDGVKLAKSYNAVDRYTKHFDKLNHESKTIQRNFAHNQNIQRLRLLVFSAIMFALFFFVAIDWLHTAVFSLIGLLLIFSRLVPRFSTWQQNYGIVLNNVPMFQKAQQMLQEFTAAAEPVPQMQPLHFTKTLHFTQVNFHYPPTEKSHDPKNILQDISCIIPINTTTAIVGHSGAGKSSFADLLLGLITPTSGNIFIDDQLLSDENSAAWRALVSYVPQDAYFFNDTIQENLLWAMPSATESDIWKVLEQSAANQFVSALPRKLDTLIGDHGIRLSGGERQRLALARALLRKPKILLLDEATSALDNQNEQQIYQTLKNLHGTMTIIVIAHRYSTIRHADQVMVLDHGQLVESGVPAELLAQENSYFHALFTAS